MNQNITEKVMRKKILGLIEEYYDICRPEKAYQEGDAIHYGGRIYDSSEMVHLVDSALDFWLTSGKYVDEFENKLKIFLNVKYCSTVNSGSSANLLAFMALTSPLLNERRIKREDEVLTIAAGFPTTVAPIVQFGAVPVFVDISIPQYNINVDLLSSALSKKTKAVMIAHTLGNPFNIEAVKHFCDVHNLWLIEDNCDALGSKYIYEGKEYYTGTIGDIGTSSFYPPHHITMGEGGAVYTNNPILHKIMRSLRDWGRDCVCSSGVDNMCGKRFEQKYGDLPLGYDHKYVYSHLGYNLKITEMQAAVGCAQLEKLPGFIQQRIQNFSVLKDALEPYCEHILLPVPLPSSTPSWFGFLITCKEGLNRNKMVTFLEENGIQTRMLFAGNMIKHPCFAHLVPNIDYRVAGKLNNTDNLLENSFWIGVYPGLKEKQLHYMIKVIRNAITTLV